MKLSIPAFAIVLGLTAGAAAQQATPQPTTSQPTPAATGTTGAAAARATAVLKDGSGRIVGDATLHDTPNGVLLKLELEKATPGVHALHLHQTGRCDAPSFESAGGHFNPSGKAHGFHDAKGPHLGDLPNIHVPASAEATYEYLIDGVTLKAGAASLFDADGSAIVLHTGPDDYHTQPAGAAGTRLACGVIERAQR